MKIAFTHNVQLNPTEEEAEFDRPETIQAIADALRRLGHEVESVDVAGSAARMVARLEALAPDLVFNTAEGKQGRFREAFYPALFDRLNFPYTGSDAYVLAVTLDKQLTKMIVAANDVPTPRWIFIERSDQIEKVEVGKLKFPVIVKPNFEGSSMGISMDSIVEDPSALRGRIESVLASYPTGVIVEEFVVGEDLTVPYLEKASPKSGGVLEPAQYDYESDVVAGRKYMIYDYEMKSLHYESVKVRVPAPRINDSIRKQAIEYTKKVIRALGICDMARIDFRLDDKGNLYFIEVNALPSLEPGASIYESASLVGLNSVDKVLGAIVASAADRYGIDIKNRKRTRRRTRVGLTFNLKRVENDLGSEMDNEAEFDSPETIGAIKEAIESYGYEVIELEATRELPSILPNAGVDVVFNVAEGIEGRTRESQVPALLDLLGIPYTGSDPTTLSLAHDKGLAKRIIAQAGLATPSFVLMTSGKERLPKDFRFPVMVKPVAEGSSRGIFKVSVVETEAELREIAHELVIKYKQSVIVESFLPGREFTVALLGERRPRALPPLEVIFPNDAEKFHTYSFEGKYFNKSITFDVPAKIDDSLKKELDRMAKGCFSALGCRDFARVDFRLDENGKVNFIECNPLPGLTPGFSDFCVIAEATGMDYRTLIGEIMAPAFKRMREKRRQNVLNEGVVR